MKNFIKQNQNGITLIALVITIIVLLILAGVSIATLTGDNGILGQASKAKTESTIGREKEQIGLAFNAVKMKKISEKDNSDITAAELKEELNYNGITDVEVTGTETLTIEFIDSKNIYTIDKNGKIAEGEIEIGIVVTPETEGIISYTDKDGNVKEFTEEVEDGDIVIYGDYEYRYNQYYSHYNWMGDAEVYWMENLEQNGWGVRVQNENFGELCKTIFEKPVVDISGTFGGTTIQDIPQIPTTINKIGYTSFFRCNNLTEITIPNNIIEIGDWSFTACSNLTKVNIPESVTSIGDTAFYECTNLTSVTIPNSVTYIGDSAFMACTNLTNVIMSDKVITIGYGAFESCTSLTSIVIPNSITIINDSAFNVCTNLENITYEGTIEEWGNITLGYNWARNVKATTVQCLDGTVDL